MSHPDPGWRLAIDFGTTATAAVTASGTTVSPLTVDGSSRMPSSVYSLPPDGVLLVGQQADQSAGYGLQRYEPTPKRRINRPHVRLGDHRHTPRELIAAILGHVIAEALQQHNGERPDAVVLTYPAAWSATERDILAAALRAADAALPDPVLIPEPVAAAQWYAAQDSGFRPEPGQYVAIYDLGGGTFDAAVLQRTDDGFAVVAFGGKDPLGGFDFEYRLFTHLGDRFIDAADPGMWHQLQYPTPDEAVDVADRRRRMQTSVRWLKEGLSTHNSLPIPLPGLTEQVLFTRAEYEQLISADVKLTVDVFLDVLEDAGVEPADLAAVYCVGGASRTPLVSRRLQALSVPLHSRDDPKLVVALGASISPEIAARVRPSKPTDVRPAPKDAIATPENAIVAPKDGVVAQKDGVVAQKDVVVAPKEAVVGREVAAPALTDAVAEPTGGPPVAREPRAPETDQDQDHPESTTPPAPPAQPPRPHRRRRRKTILTAAAALLTVVAIAVAVVIGVQKFSTGSTTPMVLSGLDRPNDVAVDATGNLYVTAGDDRVLELSAGTTTPTEVPFTGVSRPAGVAVDTAGDVYITGQGPGRVVKLVPRTATQTDLPFSGLVRPENVAVDAAGNVYVTDWVTNRVVELAAGTTTQTDLPFSGLLRPMGVAVDTAGNLYVADSGNNRVVELATGTTTQTELPLTGLDSPLGLAVDGAGNVYVADTNHNRVVKLSADKTTMTELPLSGRVRPTGVAVDTAGGVYVAVEGGIAKLPA